MLSDKPTKSDFCSPCLPSKFTMILYFSSDANPNQKLSNEEDIEAIEKELERAAEENSNQEPQQEDNNESGIEGRMAQEQQQAMEQWLRRIPDDPGGLLRRKFRYQYQRQGIDQDGNQIWPNEGAQPW